MFGVVDVGVVAGALCVSDVLVCVHVLLCCLCRYLLVLQSLKKGFAIAPEHPELHVGAINFLQQSKTQHHTTPHQTPTLTQPTGMAKTLATT